MITQKSVWTHEIPVLGAQLRDRGKAVANFHTLDRIDAHHRVGNIRIQAIKNRLSPSSRDTFCLDIDARTDGIALFDEILHVGL